jgi:hypothetical protein
MATTAQMHLQQMILHLGHVAVTGMDFVNDQQVTGERCGAQMRMLHPQSSKHGLINCSNCNCCGKVPFASFGGPSRHKNVFSDTALVVPTHVPVRQSLTERFTNL